MAFFVKTCHLFTCNLNLRSDMSRIVQVPSKKQDRRARHDRDRKVLCWVSWETLKSSLKRRNPMQFFGTLLRIVLLVTATTLILHENASASCTYPANWMNWQQSTNGSPGSKTLQNLIDIKIGDNEAPPLAGPSSPGCQPANRFLDARCVLCHNTTKGGFGGSNFDFNSYGSAINSAALQVGGDIVTRINFVKNMTSVSNTGTFSFLQEIMASAQPAWSTTNRPAVIANILLDPPATRTLTVASTNPASGVGITVSRNDNSGQGNGTTQFTRTYNDNAAVTLTAPAMAGGNNFSSWSGCDSTSGVTCNVTMNTNKAVTATYVTTRTLTVSSLNPSSVNITTVIPNDNNNLGG